MAVWVVGLVLLGDVAFTDVNVVPMDAERVLPGRTVLVRGDRIVAVGRDVEVPEGTPRVDGKGLYLMPGLADMHVHNWYEEEHVLFLANGVTTIRNLWGNGTHLRWRREIEAGERLGPALHTAGDILDGEEPIWEGSVVVTTGDKAREVVASHKARGYDALKVYNKLPRSAYIPLVEAAQEAGLRVEGHVPYEIGIEGVLVMGQDSIEHLDGYPLKDEARLVELAAKTHAWNCVTLVVYRKLVPFEEADKLRARPEMRYVPPRLLATWDPRKDFRLKNFTAETFDWLRRSDLLRLKATKILHEATGRILLGTDCGNPFVVAGWSAHEELKLLVAAGLTPYEALVCATRNPAAYVGSDSGVVAEGKRADLLLLEANPLEDVASAAKIRVFMSAMSTSSRVRS